MSSSQVVLYQKYLRASEKHPFFGLIFRGLDLIAQERTWASVFFKSSQVILDAGRVENYWFSLLYTQRRKAKVRENHGLLKTYLLNVCISTAFAFSLVRTKYTVGKITGKPKNRVQGVFPALAGSFWREPGSLEFHSRVDGSESSGSQIQTTAKVGGWQCCLSSKNTFFYLHCLNPVFSLLWISSISALSKAQM